MTVDPPAEDLLEQNQLVRRALAAFQAGRLDQAQAVLDAAPGTLLTLQDLFATFQAEQDSTLEHLRDNQHRTEQALAWFANLFHTLPLAALMLNVGGEVLEANALAVEQLHLHLALRSMAVPLRRLLVRSADEVALAQALRQVAAGQPAETLNDLPLRTLDGVPLRADLRLCALPPQPGPAGAAKVLCLVHDTTARWQAEQAREAARLADQARERAEATSAAKTHLLSRISHELRTPLNAVIGFSHLLARDVQEARTLDAGGLQRLQMIEQAGQHLLTLVNEVLEINAAEGGHLKIMLAPCSLRRAVTALLPLHTLALEAAGIRVQLLPEEGDEPLALADERRLREVLHNLLSNAIKYNRPEGELTIRLGHDVRQVWVSVQDTGRGLAPDQVAHLFEPFNRLGAEHTTIPGHGLGLSIAMALARAMGGTLEAHSTPGVGSTFTLRLQRA